MSDESIAARIERLVGEEHELRDREPTDSADALEADAQRLRDAAADAVRSAAAARWVSVAAERYREVVAQDARAARDAADGLDRAAALLRAHAGQVGVIVETLSRLEHSAVDWFRSHLSSVSLSRAQAELVPGLAGRLRAATEDAGSTP